MEQKIVAANKILKLFYELVFAGICTIFFQMVFLKVNPTSADLLVLCLLFVASYVARDILSSHIGVIVAHTCFGILSFVAPLEAHLTYIVVAWIAIHLLPSSMAYLKRNKNIPPSTEAPWPTILVVFVVYIYGIGMNSAFLKNVSFFGAILLLIIHLFQVYAEGLKGYVKQSAGVEDLPLKKIIAVNTRVVATFALLSALAMLLGRIYDFGALYTAIAALAEKLLHVVLLLIALFVTWIAKLFSTSETSTETDTASVSDTVNNFISENTYHALQTFLGVMIVLVLLMVLWKLIKRLVVALMRFRAYDGDQVIRVASASTYEARSDKAGPGAYAPTAKVNKLRRIYKRTVLLHRDDLYSLDEQATCRDILANDTFAANKSFGEMTAIYEGVRYDGVPVDGASLRRMKHLARATSKRRKV